MAYFDGDKSNYSVQIQLPRLDHYIRSRRQLGMPLATGFELLAKIPLEFAIVRENHKLASSPRVPMHSPSEGYVYVPEEEDGPLSRARTGAIVRLNYRRPPWIVVDHSIDSVIVARWPGKLWRVTIIDAKGVEQASDHATYTRAVAVKVCGEVPASRLFGEHGEAVWSVISRASQLEIVGVQALANARHPDAGQAFSRAWHKWLAEVGRGSDYRGRNLAGALGIGGSPPRSPIGCGFTVLDRVIWDRADLLVGTSAFFIDEEGEKYLEPTWASADNAMLEAAMAFGAPRLSGPEDRVILLAAWHAIFTDPEERSF